MKILREVIMILVIPIALSACVALPPQGEHPETIAEVLSDKSWQQRIATDVQSKASTIDEQLLTLFDDRALQTIVQQALDNNLDLKIAEERLRQANLLTKISAANRSPSISAGIHSTRSSDSLKTSQDYTADLSLSWELDIWGKLGQQYAAEKATEQSTIRDYQAARNSIAAQTMQLWFEILSYYQLIDIQKQHIVTLQQTEAITLQQYRDGLATIHDVDKARGYHEDAQVSLFAKQQQLTSSHYQLQTLLGEYPALAVNPMLTLPQNLPAVPVGIPAHTLHYRADLQAAWLRVEAAQAVTASSYLSMYPSIELTGSSGKTSTSLSTLLEQPSVWSLLGMIKIPLFQAGRLKNNYRTSRSQQQQAYIEFLQKILTAFHEVETALSIENSLHQQEQLLRDSLQSAQRGVKQAANDYRMGHITINDYLDIQATLFSRQSNFITVLNQRLQNRVNLGLAMGKGV